MIITTPAMDGEFLQLIDWMYPFIRKLKRVKKGKTRKNEDELVFSIYNVYANKNPFSVFFGQEDGRTKLGEPVNTRANQFSIIGSIVPSISYNFNI